VNLNNTRKPIRIGIDTGGTFTDFVVVSRSHINAWKVPTTPEDPSIGIIQGLKDVMRLFEFDKEDIELLIIQS